MSEKPISISDAVRLRQAGRLLDAWQALAPWVSAGDAAATEEAARVAELLGHQDEAIRLLESATTIAPTRTTAWVNLAAIRAETQDARGAAEAARVATQLAPRLIAAWINLGSALAALQDYTGAIEAFSAAVSLEPSDAELICDLASAEFAGGEVGAAARRLQSSLARDPSHARSRSLLLLVLHHATNDAQGLAHAHAQFATSHGVLAPTPLTVARDPSVPLRVGLVSGDFRRHSVWYFLAGLLEQLPTSTIELHCFHTDPAQDDITARWRQNAHRFIAAAELQDDALETVIRDSNLDVLISLGGHTTAARPTLFLRRIAPVQASFLGYPGPIGSPNVDYWITDSVVAPPAETPLPWVSQLARLPHSYFCFSPGDAPVPLSVRRPGEPVVFGSFNVLAKISAVTVRLWSDVLKAIPDATLLLKSDAVQGPAAARLAREFAAQGIGAERILMADWSVSREAHLARYAEVDISLDTFPYNGATTTCESLWMGVPVVSLYGRTPASRMGRSILSAAGLSGWCVEDSAAFVQVAQGLAAEVAALRTTRAALRTRVLESALCDQRGYAEAFVALLGELTPR